MGREGLFLFVREVGRKSFVLKLCDRYRLESRVRDR